MTAENDSARALDAITRIASAIDAPELLECLHVATDALGASGSLYTASIPENERETLNLSLYACDPTFAQQQRQLGPLVDHPWFRFARSHSMPGTHLEVELTHDSDAAAVALAARYGFRACLIVPVSQSAAANRVEMLCLGSDNSTLFEDPQTARIRTLARALAGELHDWLSRYLSARLREAARLQPSDIELLRMEYEGLGTKEIAQRTGMTSASVDSRFQRINVRMECASRKASARRAAAYGLLEKR
ncbi:sigma-70 region 4 domain-containing protein [Piscinibacter sp. HJYY11]|uniref:sigma-70 region 4 domain-containing protein n=1 Tax=Piscinibacter sp. HJYY11 TaxID=2801333 RepID=UPI00191E7E94|nr:sigma-70 region 4 domain-containing protein [Piscinibacter sp. HJYY11]MBL0726134.1 sigma-70 region 4 domain-containing protein [Piscinibacter sp. HJYY11]